jgi:hypothetical protein
LPVRLPGAGKAACSPGETLVPKISDFGLAKRLDEGGLTQTGDLLEGQGMQRCRASSYDEFVDWYLARERRKKGTSVPTSARDRREEMRTKHPGKIRPWFSSGVWDVVLLDQQDLERLIFYEDQATKSSGLVNPNDGLNYRLLGKVAENARKSQYLTRVPGSGHVRYYQALRDGHFLLEHSSSIVICTPNAGERLSNPNGLYYLHDGTGRALPYLMLVKEGHIPFEPVMAFRAEEV